MHARHNILIDILIRLHVIIYLDYINKNFEYIYIYICFKVKPAGIFINVIYNYIDVNLIQFISLVLYNRYICIHNLFRLHSRLIA